MNRCNILSLFRHVEKEEHAFAIERLTPRESVYRGARTEASGEVVAAELLHVTHSLQLRALGRTPNDWQADLLPLATLFRHHTASTPDILSYPTPGARLQYLPRLYCLNFPVNTCRRSGCDSGLSSMTSNDSPCRHTCWPSFLLLRGLSSVRKLYLPRSIVRLKG